MTQKEYELINELKVVANYIGVLNNLIHTEAYLGIGWLTVGDNPRILQTGYAFRDALRATCIAEINRLETRCKEIIEDERF